MPGLAQYIAHFPGQSVLIVGDLIADKFIIGQPERLSREAPVIILVHRQTEIVPGGGANAAHNICSLGGRTDLVGIIGDDRTGKQLYRLLQEKGVGLAGTIISGTRQTTIKTRVLAGGDDTVKQQVVRIDYLNREMITRQEEERFLDYVKGVISQYDGVLLSDYGNGLFSHKLAGEIIKLARQRDMVVAVDSRYNLYNFKGATIATPNLEEIGYALERNGSIYTQDEVLAAGRWLREELELEYLLVTQGGDGMTLFTEEECQHIPAANYAEVYDVTGAGDTVVGVLTLALCAGADVTAAVKLANYAAGIVIKKSGVSTVEPGELRREVLFNEGEEG